MISFALQLSPAAGTIVGNDVFEHDREGMCVDGFALVDDNGASGRVVAACGDDSLGIGDYGAACLCSLTSREITDTPTIASSSSRIGATVSEAGNTVPSFRTRTVSR